MRNLTILHLSDLHFSPSKYEDIRIVQEALFADLDHFKGEGICPDIVIFSGDLIEAGDYGYSEQRGDYASVRSEFIEPLLEHLDLDIDRFFLCPGNHDIQRSKVDEHEYLEEGLSRKLTNRESVNALIDNFENRMDVFARMENFETFKKSISSKFVRESNVLYSTYSLDQDSEKIGIVCINSAWRAYGGEGDDGRERDYGKLLIGERTVYRCLDSLADCNFKIGVVHHPFEYLQLFDQDDLKLLVSEEFDVWLTGHTHKHEVGLVQLFNNERIIFIRGGALYKSRKYYNGYSLITCSLAERTGRVFLREYRDERRRFVAALVYSESEGVVPFALAEPRPSPLSGKFALIARMRETVTQAVNGRLLSGTLEQSVAPKELKKAFVEPPLAMESEFSTASKTRGERKETVRALDEVLESGENILFIGKKESGKTTLLNYICTRYLEPNNFEQKIPILIDYEKIPSSGKNRVERAIGKYLVNCQINLSFDLKENLQRGNCLILIDDLDLRNRKSLASLKRFAEDYAQNRYMFTIDEDVLEDMELDSSHDLGVEYEKIYIHSFGRKQIKELAAKWFHEILTDVRIQELSDRIIQSILGINMPLTPLVISWVLLIIEQLADYDVRYVPINKASLLERLMELFLEKMNPSEVRADQPDYVIKEHFLSHMAHYMVREMRYRLDIAEFEKETIDYFAEKGLPIPSRGGQSFVNYFISTGILAKDNGEIFFRFRSFCEFFIAKYMIRNRDFRDEILKEGSYLQFANEIEYLTGLKRENKDLVTLIQERTEKALEDLLDHIGLRVDLEYFDDIRFSQDVIDSLSERDSETREVESILERLKKSRMDEEVKDDLTDALYRLRTPDDQQIVRPTFEDYETLAFANLALLSSVIRNCELLDIEFKKQSVNACVRSFLVFLYVSILKSEEFVRELELEKILEYLQSIQGEAVGSLELIQDSRFKDTFNDYWKTFLFLLVETVLHALMGTPKLGVVLEKEIDNLENHISLRLMYTLLYFDLGLPGHLHRIERIVREARKSRYYRKIIRDKIFAYCAMRRLSQREEQRLKLIITNLEGVHPHDKTRRASQIRLSGRA